eukprot:9473029-Pyramimonas_sp.AAC.1
MVEEPESEDIESAREGPRVAFVMVPTALVQLPEPSNIQARRPSRKSVPLAEHSSELAAVLMHLPLPPLECANPLEMAVLLL